jgi:hypothetical protein
MKLVSNFVNSIPIQTTTLVSLIASFQFLVGFGMQLIIYLMNLIIFGVFNTWLYILEFL